MKLVEIDDNNILPWANKATNLDDDSYANPRVMSTLDNVMNEILSSQLSDGEKWKLYSQALQRFLNHSKLKSRKIDSALTTNIDDRKLKSPVAENTFNLSLGDISFPNQFDMSGVERIRDSMDNISQPSVRNFFEKAREASSHSISPQASDQAQAQPTQRRKRTKKNPSRRVQPYRSTAAAGKRRAERSLTADMSLIRPCKVALHRLNWSSTTAR